MKDTTRFALIVTVALLLLNSEASLQERKSDMTFFITSVGSGRGADLGGLAGADRQCQLLAQAAGSGNRTWQAYLSTSPSDGKPAVNARDRIGRGPWQNSKGIVIARDVN
ncbi:MAG: lectin, partial [Candidatus Binatia bacterium]